MHELKVTQDILSIVLEEANKMNAAGVTDIWLTIGHLSSIVDDFVQFYWDFISEGTICKGALLHFNRPPAVLQCRKCQTTFTLEDELLPCPSCNSFDLEVFSGDEMQVDQIEIERDPNQ